MENQINITPSSLKFFPFRKDEEEIDEEDIEMYEAVERELEELAEEYFARGEAFDVDFKRGELLYIAATSGY
jgi:hypothetical protein